MKKIFSILALVCFIIAFSCACAKDKGGSSSNITENESIYSKNETSSLAQTSSKQEDVIESSSKKEESSQTSVISSEIEQEEQEASSETESKQPIRGIKPADALGVGMYHFSLDWTYNYSKEENPRENASLEDKIEEFRDVVEAGYVNTIICPSSYLNNDEMWDILIKNKVSVWVSMWNFYDSSKKSYAEWAEPYEKELDKLKTNKERWELFCGFHHEENIWRGQSNADFLEMTESLYRKYGKRNMPVFATGEFTGYEGNQNQIDMDATNMKKINPKALAYVTDTAFDSYSVDVRDGYGNGTYIAKINKTYPNVVDGKTYYSEYTKIMLDLYDHDVNVWYFPCGYTTYLWSGLRADESYCLAHLNFFKELLEEQKYQGGMFLYTYQQFSNAAELGLQSHLLVTKNFGEIKLRPKEDKWLTYSERLKEIAAEYKETLARHATFNK